MATTDRPTDAPTTPYDRGDIGDLPRPERRRLYERLLSITTAQATPEQLPWTRQVALKQQACRVLPCRPDAVVKLIDDLVDRKRLLRWWDSDDNAVVCVRESQTLARVQHVLDEDDYDRAELRAWVLKHLEACR